MIKIIKNLLRKRKFTAVLSNYRNFLNTTTNTVTDSLIENQDNLAQFLEDNQKTVNAVIKISQELKNIDLRVFKEIGKSIEIKSSNVESQGIVLMDSISELVSQFKEQPKKKKEKKNNSNSFQKAAK